MDRLKTTVLVCAVFALVVACGILLLSFKGGAPSVSPPAAQVESLAAGVEKKFDSSKFSDSQIKGMSFSVDEKNTKIDPWLNGFLYRQPITITSSAALTNYQVKLTLNTKSLTDAGKLRTDCNDLRFTASDGYTRLNYYLESGNATNATVVWVKVPSLASGSTTIYMYYGNSALASAYSSGANTFVFFDDFNAASLNSSMWNTTSHGTCTVSQTGGNLKMAIGATGYDGCGVTSFVTVPSTDYKVESSMMREAGYDGGELGAMVGFTDKSTFDSSYYGYYGSHDAYFNIYEYSSSSVRFRMYYDSAGVSGSTSWPSWANQWVRISLTYLHSAKEVYANFSWASTNQTLGPTSAGTNQLSSLYVQINYGDYNQNGYSAYCDWVGVRQYAATEPTASAGSETALVTEAGSATSWSWKAPASGNMVPSGSATSWTWTTWQDDGTGLTVPSSSAASWTWYP